MPTLDPYAPSVDDEALAFSRGCLTACAILAAILLAAAAVVLTGQWWLW